MPVYCTQCGIEGRPIPAIGEDSDGEPACSGHTQKGTVTVTMSKEFCACGREKGHKGRHRGPNFNHNEVAASVAPPPIAPQLPAPKHTAVVKSDKHKTLRQEVEKEFPEAISFVADSAMHVPLAHGEIMLMVRGDLLELLSDKDDRHFILALLNVIRCRGKMMNPFDNTMKDKATGNMIPVQMDEGFVDDMFSCFNAADKARMLAAAWEKGK